MTWFRVGGTGIPASLKNGMNAVLNKKFGTSGQNYPPNGWPDEVNLMGPLPEGTASGPIANITDGAEDVPIKNWLVTLPASLDGYSEVNGVRSGKNLLDVSTAQGTGTIWFYYDNGILLKKGVTYTLSCKNYGVGSISFYGTDHTTQLAYASISASSAKVSYTPSENVYACPRIYQSGLTPSGLIDAQLEVGSTATSYEAYEAPTQYTASLGRTIYGGTADIVTGEGEDENGDPFTFTPIQAETELGTNNFWADEGDSDVTYRRDIDLALQSVSSSRGLMMASRPVTQLVGEESDPDQVNELVENDETEQEGENNAR